MKMRMVMGAADAAVSGDWDNARLELFAQDFINHLEKIHGYRILPPEDGISDPVKRKRKCGHCKNKRFIIVKDKPEPCFKCNKNGKKFKLKEITICLGCGCDTAKRDCGCPAGTGKALVTQN
jgi:hypothetical protein